MPEARWSRVSPADLFPAVPEVSDRGRHAAPSPDEPVYSRLVSEWRTRGRMLPGQRDREWIELVIRPSWRPSPLGRAGEAPLRSGHAFE